MPTATIRIPQPCAESWDAMSPTDGGRHCAACQKTVVDFTQKTDAEILATLRRAAGETCGRLRADQVERPLVVPTTAPRWRNWLGAALALAGILGAGRVAAQARANYYAGPQPLTSPTGNATPEPGPRPPGVPAEPTAATNGLATLRGTVTDSTTHEPLPGVTVLVKGTDIGTSTDRDGNFSLPVPAGKAALLSFSFVGFVSQERLVATTGTQQLAVALVADTRMLGGLEVAIAGGLHFRQPWPWHPRRFFNWSKYWVTKPFRS